MSRDNQDGYGKEVQDDGTVDRKLKDKIIEARQRIDAREDFLYVEAPVDNAYQIGEHDQDKMWGMVVKQFLRKIKPLLQSDEITTDRDYYEGVELGEIQLIPRDVRGYPFSQVATGAMDGETFKLQYDLPRDVELPKVEVVEFHGLKSVLKRDPVVSKEWVVQADAWNAPGQNGVIRTGDAQAIPREIYEEAIFEADKSLQEAGIGLELGASEVESRPEPI